jgi:hypothetical protein
MWNDNGYLGGSGKEITGERVTVAIHDQTAKNLIGILNAYYQEPPL